MKVFQANLVIDWRQRFQEECQKEQCRQVVVYRIARCVYAIAADVRTPNAVRSLLLSCLRVRGDYLSRVILGINIAKSANNTAAKGVRVPSDECWKTQ